MAQQEISSLHTELLARLKAVRRREHAVDLGHGILAAVLIILLLLLFVVVLEQLFLFGTLPRTILFAVAAAGIAGSVAWLIGRPLLRLLGILKAEDNFATAAKVGNHFSNVRDRLLDALQMYEGKEALRANYSLSLIDASFSDLIEIIRPLNFADAVGNFRVRRMRKFVLYAAALFALVFIISPSGFFGSFHRIVNFGQTFAAPAPIEFIVEPGNTQAVRGQNVAVTVRTKGRPIEALSFRSRAHGQVDFESQTLNRNGDGSFQTSIQAIRATTEYLVEAGDVKSSMYIINVLDRPLIRSLQLKILSPPYTRIPPKIPAENVGDVTALPGTKVVFQIVASKELSGAYLAFGDSSNVKLDARGSSAGGSLVVRKDGSYHIVLHDHDGLPNVDPIEYAVKVIPDEYPTVEVLAPAKNVDLAGEMKLDLYARAKDDFGFTRLRLAYRMAQSKYEKPSEEYSYIDVSLPRKDQSPVDVPYQWDLTPLSLVPEDAVAYYFEIFDNDNVSGPKSGRSETYLVRLPSLEEVLADVGEQHQQSMESMQDVSKETQQLRKDIEEMQLDLKKNAEKTDWQHQKKAEEMVQRYEAMKNKLQEATKKLDDAVKKMDENKLLSPETLEKYSELQKLMEKLNSPELQEALKKLQESMKQLSPDQLKQAMEQLKSSEEQFRASLERTIELLKRIHIEQKLDELTKRAEELKRQQEALRDRTQKTPPSDKDKLNQLAKEQSDLQKEEESMEKEAGDLKDKMEEFPKEMPLEEMTKAQKSLQEKQTGNKMKKSAQQMQSGDMKSAQQSQQESEQDLSEFSEQMQQVKKSLQDKQMKQVVNQMRKQIENMVELSKRQEELKDNVKSRDPNSQQFRSDAQEQNDLLNDLNNVANAAGDLGKKTFAVTPEMGREIGNAMKQMSEALQNMEGRNPGGSSQKQGEAMGSLNRAAMMMQNSLNAMMQNGSGGMGMAGLMGRLGQMAGQQGTINSGTQQAMGQGQGQEGALSAQQQAEYQRLSGEQAAVHKSLEELSKEAKNTGEFSKLLGDLDRIAQEMQEVQTDLQQGDVNPNTVKKQENILSRLLDSQRSMRERDYEKRRKAEAGKDLTGQEPPRLDLTTQEGKNKLRDELLKVLQGRYSRDYEALIKKYFEELEKQEGRGIQQ